MNINLMEITVRELYDGYEDNDEEGVIGFGGKLDIRPKYQREFIYSGQKRKSVIDTLYKGFPLNVMYWAVKSDGTFELMDGQQRTISICQYIQGDYFVRIGDFPDERAFYNLKNDEQENILNYKLMIYLCEGSEEEKLKWFETINIAGVELTNQEMRNAIFAGPWLSDAKRYFSKTNSPATRIAGDYLNGKANRQENLETVIKWISNGSSNDNIVRYMAIHQNYENADELWTYFNSVIEWVKRLFLKKRKEMKSVNWGFLYNEFKDNHYNPEELEEEIVSLYQNDDVTNKRGIYEYLFYRKEKYLNIRKFTKSQISTAFDKQNGICVICKDEFNIEDMEADHITPWHEGGKTDVHNLQMLCKSCNRKKSGK
jgi:hypothetical protein